MSEEMSLDQYRALVAGGTKAKPKVASKKAAFNFPVDAAPPEMGRQVIMGTCPSKSNSYRIVNNKLVKSAAMAKYEESFYIQCNQYRNANITGYFELHMQVFYPNQRSDVDGALKAVLDCLQRVKAIPNDNKCTKIVLEKYLDKERPRIEFSIVKA